MQTVYIKKNLGLKQIVDVFSCGKGFRSEISTRSVFRFFNHSSIRSWRSARNYRVRQFAFAICN